MQSQTSSKFVDFAEKISKGLKTAQQEIEELALQFSLGKADASEIFEDLKKEFNARTHEWKQGYAKIKTLNNENVIRLKTKFEELQLQLSLGKADAKEIFDEQRKKILKAINEMEAEIRENPELQEQLNDFKTEIEKFKLKLEILKLRFDLKKIYIREDFKSEMSDAREKIVKIFDKVEERWDEAKIKRADFKDEIDLAYKHLKKAVSKL